MMMMMMTMMIFSRFSSNRVVNMSAASP